MILSKREAEILKDSILLQLPTMVAILASTQEDFNSEDAVDDAIELYEMMLAKIEVSE